MCDLNIPVWLRNFLHLFDSLLSNFSVFKGVMSTWHVKILQLGSGVPCQFSVCEWILPSTVPWSNLINLDTDTQIKIQTDRQKRVDRRKKWIRRSAVCMWEDRICIWNTYWDHNHLWWEISEKYLYSRTPFWKMPHINESIILSIFWLAEWIKLNQVS